MAKELTNIPTNLTEYPNSFKRQGAFPLEAYEVFYSLDDAKQYAKGENTNAGDIGYVGQTLKVVEGDSVKTYTIKNENGELEPIVTSADLSSSISELNSDITDKLSSKASISSPAFIDSPTAPTPQSLEDKTSKRIATVEFVHNLIDSLDIVEIDGGGVPQSVINGTNTSWNGEYEVT